MSESFEFNLHPEQTSLRVHSDPRSKLLKKNSNLSLFIHRPQYKNGENGNPCSEPMAHNFNSYLYSATPPYSRCPPHLTTDIDPSVLMVLRVYFWELFGPFCTLFSWPDVGERHIA